jgi:hypothetical protein
LGHLGIGTNTNKWYPVAVNSSGILENKNISKISVGQSASCFLTEDSIVACSGFNGYFFLIILFYYFFNYL